MATYYIMTCPSAPLEADPALLIYLPDEDGRGWETGVKFSHDPNDFPEEQEPETPVRFQIMEGNEGVLREMWEAPAPLMTKRLGQALRDAGVANIDEYDAVIEDLTTGETHTNYVAFNIVGLVAATDHANSKYDSEIRWFDQLSLDEDAPREALLFRLKDAPYHIIVHERVKTHLEKAGFDMLRFTGPRNYALPGERDE